MDFEDRPSHGRRKRLPLHHADSDLSLTFRTSRWQSQEALQLGGSEFHLAHVRKLCEGQSRYTVRTHIELNFRCTTPNEEGDYCLNGD
jgi:hypothetical protein